MKRDKNGRFQKKSTIEFVVPSLSNIIKYLILFFVLTPWIYLIFKFDGLYFLGMMLATMFGPIEGNKPPKTPY